jgi:hypothetical protein
MQMKHWSTDETVLFSCLEHAIISTTKILGGEHGSVYTYDRTISFHKRTSSGHAIVLSVGRFL